MTKHEVELHDLAHGREGGYTARVWRTEVLRREAAQQVAKMIRAFVPEGFHIDIRRDRLVVDPRGGGDRVWPVVAVLRDKAPEGEGSDAHFFVAAETVDGALAKLLAIVLDGGGFFPLT